HELGVCASGLTQRDELRRISRNPCGDHPSEIYDALGHGIASREDEVVRRKHEDRRGVQRDLPLFTTLDDRYPVLKLGSRGLGQRSHRNALKVERLGHIELRVRADVELAATLERIAVDAPRQDDGHLPRRGISNAEADRQGFTGCGDAERRRESAITEIRQHFDFFVDRVVGHTADEVREERGEELVAVGGGNEIALAFESPYTGPRDAFALRETSQCLPGLRRASLPEDPESCFESRRQHLALELRTRRGFGSLRREKLIASHLQKIRRAAAEPKQVV